MAITNHEQRSWTLLGVQWLWVVFFIFQAWVYHAAPFPRWYSWAWLLGAAVALVCVTFLLPRMKARTTKRSAKQKYDDRLVLIVYWGLVLAFILQTGDHWHGTTRRFWGQVAWLVLSVVTAITSLSVGDDSLSRNKKVKQPED